MGKWNFAPEDILILQFDSRGLADYWGASSSWNKAYAQAFGHSYMFMSIHGDCRNGDVELSPSWCKIKAMLEVSKTQQHKVVVFLDSDAIITANHSMSAVLEFVAHFTKWNVSEHPVAFNQDGPGYACRHALKIGYNVCLNSGTVIWVKSKLSTKILSQWWNYAKKADETLFKKDWRKKWPWEQAPQYEVLKANAKHIHLLSYPEMAYLPWSNQGAPTLQYPDDTVEPYCFSHWPGAGCFVTHFCASRRQKQRLLEEYSRPPFPSLTQTVTVEYLELG
eukprot:gene30225-36528_t